MERKIRNAFLKKDLETSKEYHISNDFMAALIRKDNLISRYNNIILLFFPLHANLSNMFIILISELFVYNEYPIKLTYNYLFIIITLNSFFITVTNIFTLFLHNIKQLKFINFEYQREKWEMENNLQGEINEMIQIYVQKHKIPFNDANLIVKTLIKYPQVFLDTMFFEELGLLPPDNSISFTNNTIFSTIIITLNSLFLIFPYVINYVIFNCQLNILLFSFLIFIINMSTLNSIIKN